MKKSKFREEQIVRILKEIEAGAKVMKPAASMGSASRRTTCGRTSTSGWTCRSCGT
jgi:hypothetical protein